jgi:type IV secretion system protein TrbJ
MNKTKEYISILISSLLVSQSCMYAQNSYAWRGVATEVTQWLNFGVLSAKYAKQVQSYITQISQFQNEVQQYMNMIKNTVNLPNELWHDFAGQVSQVATIYKKVRGITDTLMNADDELKQIYKNYDFYRIKNMGVKDYFLQYGNWNKTNSVMYERMMSMLGAQASGIEDEQHIVEKLLKANKGDTGQKQALQIGNELTGMMIQQLQQLRQLIMGQNELVAKVKAQEEQEKAATKAAEERMFRSLKQDKWTIEGDEQGY